MTFPKPKGKSGGKQAPAFVKQSAVDDDGIPRVVLLPGGATDANMGIPVSLDLTPIFGHMPPDWQRKLYTALHAQGLVEAADYMKPGAGERFRSAMLYVIKHDFQNVQTLAKQESQHG